MLKENEKIVLTCEEMNNFGNCVCRVDGMVVFVNGAVTGDTVEVEIKKVNSSYALADAVKILIPSTKRIAPICPKFGSCGGCAFCHMHIDSENSVKQSYVKGTLEKFGISADVEKTVCPVSEEYRNKVILFFQKGAFGYMARSTNQVVPHKRCPLNKNIFDKIAEYTLNKLDTSYLRALYMRRSESTGQIMVCPIFKKPTDIKHYAKHIVNDIEGVTTVLHGFMAGRELILEKCEIKTVVGDGYIEDDICGLRFRISPKSFYQVNHACATELYEKAIDLADIKETETVADLFCGTGTVGMIVAHRTGAKVYGVEIEPDAVKDAKYNAKLNGISNIEFFEGDAKDFDKKTDICIIDPPRKGCSELMIETLMRLSPEKIVYISCNPDTLARDLKRLGEKYAISSSVTPFNMFPRTSHVESVVCLTRE